jgi:hypothetical protein
VVASRREALVAVVVAVVDTRKEATIAAEAVAVMTGIINFLDQYISL